MTPAVCLIIPPSPFLLDERVFMSLGILKIAATLEARGAYVEVLDLSGYVNFADAAAAHAKSSSVRHFGITATTPQLPAAVDIAEAIRAARPDARLILGGPHITLTNAARKREQRRRVVGRAARAFERLERHFDVLVAGDGEETIFLACAADAPRLIDADDRRSPLFLNSERLERTPFPARHLIDVDSYHYTIDGEPALSVIAQLGCPFGCGFCAGRNSPMLRHIRRRSAQNIVAEITDIHRRWGHRGFMFYDDELNVDRGMLDLMRRIAAAQRAAGVEWRLRGFIKAELFTEAQAEAMYAAGFRWILVGFESGASRILENINKKATQQENTRCVDIARRHGLKVKALMSLGHPGESAESTEETRRWLLDVRPADFDISVITPYPGSPYYDDAVATADPNVWSYTVPNGDVLYQSEIDYTRVADYYKGSPDDGYVSHVFTEHLSAAEIVRYRDDLERDVRQLLGIPFNPSAASNVTSANVVGTTLKVNEGATTVATLTLSTSQTGNFVYWANDGSGGTDIFLSSVVCYLAGTHIRTPDGEVAVEDLAVGDRVLTNSGDAKPIRWLGRQTVSRIFGDPLRVLPIRIEAGALDENVPSRDLLISPDHAVLVDDILVHAGALVNGVSIRRESNVPTTFTYYHIELANHALILAENTPAETFIDNVDRMAFDNWEEHQALDGAGDAPLVEMEYPRAKAHRQVPLSIRARLAERAESLYGVAAVA